MRGAAEALFRQETRPSAIETPYGLADRHVTGCCVFLDAAFRQDMQVLVFAPRCEAGL